ncbi:MAG: DNA repair protein RecN [Candidatus Kapabacteria bacterium]|nr:DNA repair protein RecN [Candidatus Kapabacteria bacterium]
MLETLKIVNFALIDELEITFSSGLNIISGETGAGKSIICDALLLTLGERANSEYIRSGTSKATVEAYFSTNLNPQISKILTENEIEINPHNLILRREIKDKGNSRCFVNDSPVTASILKKIGDYLVDFHGQHDHQSLLSAEKHIEILDSIGDYGDLFDLYQNEFSDQNKLLDELNNLRQRAKNLTQRMDYVNFELNEFNKISPKPDEDEEINIELNIIENSELLFNKSTELFELLYDGEKAVTNAMARAEKIINSLAVIDKSFAEYENELRSARYVVSETANFAANYKNSLSFDPMRSEELRLRLSQLSGLKKKYGSIKFACEKAEEYRQEIETAFNIDSVISSITSNISESRKSLGKIASEITTLRKKSAKIIEKAVQEALVNLGIKHSIFMVNFKEKDVLTLKSEETYQIAAYYEGKKYTAYQNGIDKLEFYISTNLGEKPKLLTEVASGGEVSRVMLAIKSIIAERDNVPVMVFDEIDTGISGRIARKAGIAMKELSHGRQIITITHLPQIASLSDTHLYVAKSEKSGKTYISVQPLNHNEKIIEIARLLSGEQISDSSLQSASFLIQNY